MELQVASPARAKRTLVLAHGAGVGMHSPFMDAIAEGLAANGLRVVRFEFPYMRRRQETGKSRPPDREPLLRATWLELLEQIGEVRPIIGGKSMGGRIASLIADDVHAAGLICLGDPFHPPGKPEQLRTEHLRRLATPALILQGERDPFDSAAEVSQYELAPAIQLVWLPDGDHSFKPRKASGFTEQQNWQSAAESVARFVRSPKR